MSSLVPICARSCALVVVLCLLAGMVQPAAAVIVSTTTGNTTAPGDDPGWANVGVIGTSSGVYLGNGWVITVDHVGAADIDLAGQNYDYVPGTSVRLRNPTGQGLTQFTDLEMFRIEGDPGLPSLPLARESVPINGAVMMIGHGRNREAEPTHWSLFPSGGNTFWFETGPPGDRSGFTTTSSQTMRWGTNRVENDEARFGENDFGHQVEVNIDNNGDVLSLFTDFDAMGGDIYEAQGAVNDSGGAVFFKRSGRWELAGIIHGIGTSDDQPSSAIAFGNVTYFADLPEYRDQLEFWMSLDINAPWQHPLNPFDVDNNGQLTPNDALLLIDELEDEAGALPAPTEDMLLGSRPFVDVNGDNFLTPADLLTVYQELNAMAAASNLSAASGMWSTGGLAGDLEATVVPEPSTVVLAIGGALLLAVGVYSRRRARTVASGWV